ncbi:hypothetical protein F5Y07DRAFT_52389 [Xylaria sp. FL0933]|nr:hypothetical protein F5Y07DRAFT_52389 [Xylaria sp. FL0933]
MQLTKLFTFVTFTTVTAGWKNTVAFEFPDQECAGQLIHASIGMNYQQIKMRNTTQSVYISTVNDGIYRWYGFPGATEDGSGCYGDIVGRLNSSSCFDLTSFVPQGKPKVECIRLCSLLSDKESSYSCAAIGVTDKVEWLTK